MKRKFWVIAAVVALSASAIGLAAALAGDGSDADDASPSIGIPAPSDYIDDTEGLDVGVLPVYDGPLDDLPATDGPIEEPITGGEVPIGQFSGDTPIVRDLGDSSVSGMVVPGSEGVTDTVVVFDDGGDSGN